jgi:RNA polymerase sigma-70 factor (ECF subfamily)
MNVHSQMSAPVAPPADNALHDGLVIARSLHDPEQFAIVFRRHAPQIQRYVVRRIGRDAADDVVGETFLQAFRQRANYRIDLPDARPWLYGIATNLIAATTAPRSGSTGP